MIDLARKRPFFPESPGLLFLHRMAISADLSLSRSLSAFSLLCDSEKAPQNGIKKRKEGRKDERWILSLLSSPRRRQLVCVPSRQWSLGGNSNIRAGDGGRECRVGSAARLWHGASVKSDHCPQEELNTAFFSRFLAIC